MSSGIMNNDTMFSVKIRPWHELGSVLDSAPSIEDALKLSGLNWTVLKGNLYDDRGTLHDMQYTYRYIANEADSTVLDQYTLGYVPKSYQVLQNEQALNWFNPFIESGQATLETAGSLFNGEIIFITAKIGSDLLEIDTDDAIEKFVLLSNSHNGRTAVRVGFTPVRVVCNNTLKMAHTDQASKLLRVKHTVSMQASLIDIQSTIDLVNQQFIATAEQFKRLASKDVNQSDLNKYIKIVFNREKLESALNVDNTEVTEIDKQTLEYKISEIFSKEDKHNYWTAYNSIQGYLQHEKGLNRSTPETRYNSMWFGESDRLNVKALKTALTLV